MSLIMYVICACRLVSPRTHAGVYSLLFPSLLWKDSLLASCGIPMRCLQSWGLTVACTGWWVLGRYKCPPCCGGHLCAWLRLRALLALGVCTIPIAREAVSLQGLLGERFPASSWADIPDFGLELAFFLADRPLLAPLATLRSQDRWCSLHPAFPA